MLEIIQSAIEGLAGKLSDVTRTRILLTRIEDWEQSRQCMANFSAIFVLRTRYASSALCSALYRPGLAG
jgi:hypothetical protein